MPVDRQPVYAQIAAQLRAAILAGDYEPTDEDASRAQLPSVAELGARYDVSVKTAARAVQQLVTSGLVMSRSGKRPLVIPRAERPSHWPMSRRYARARSGGGLVFGADMHGRDVVKRVTDVGWIPAPAHVAALLGIETGERVWRRARETLVASQVTGRSTSFFPADLAQAAPDLRATGPFPGGGVVAVLEAAGHTITRTYNEVRARRRTDEESAAFGDDAAIVLEVSHATFGAFDEALEAVVDVRPADANVLTFETYEAP